MVVAAIAPRAAIAVAVRGMDAAGIPATATADRAEAGAVRVTEKADIPAKVIAATAGDGEAPATGMVPARVLRLPPVPVMAGRRAITVTETVTRMHRAVLPITTTPRIPAVTVVIV